MTTITQVIAALPTAPNRSMVATVYVPTADAWVAALPTFGTQMNTVATQMNTVAGEVSTNATNAAASATAAATSASAAAASATAALSTANATIWAGATAYTAGQNVISPITYGTYRRLISGTTATDPSADTTNWLLVSLPSPASHTNQFLQSTGTSYQWASTIGLPTAQGRLTLTTLTPIMVADATAQSTVYYTPYIGNEFQLYNGTAFVSTVFAETSLALDSNAGHTNYHQSGKLFDLYMYSDSGTIRLGTGPAWTSSTARGTGAGTTELQMLLGIWTNKNSITLRFGSVSGNTTVVAANQATYVGTMYATADGQTGMAFKPAGVSSGNSCFLGLYNSYNRVKTVSVCTDSSAWSYTTNTWRSAHGSSSNRISFVDGLAQSPIVSKYVTTATGSSGAAKGIGLNFDSTSATPLYVGGTVDSSGSGPSVSAEEFFQASLGLHYIQAMEVGAAGGAFGTVANIALSNISISLDM
jgi:hypothetical protein